MKKGVEILAHNLCQCCLPVPGGPKISEGMIPSQFARVSDPSAIK
jgi:hypothetical protein